MNWEHLNRLHSGEDKRVAYRNMAWIAFPFTSSTFVTPSPSSASKGNKAKKCSLLRFWKWIKTKIVNYSLSYPLTSISVKNSSPDHSIDKLPQAALIIIYKIKEKQFKKWDSNWSVQFEIPSVICITIQCVLMAAVMRWSKFMKNIYLLTHVLSTFTLPWLECQVNISAEGKWIVSWGWAALSHLTHSSEEPLIDTGGMH